MRRELRHSIVEIAEVHARTAVNRQHSRPRSTDPTRKLTAPRGNREGRSFHDGSVVPLRGTASLLSNGCPAERDRVCPSHMRHFGSPLLSTGGLGRLWLGCLLYTSDAADDLLCVDLGGRRIIKK